MMEKFWCGNCGKKGTLTQVVQCKCKKREPEDKWMNSRRDIVEPKNERTR